MTEHIAEVNEQLRRLGLGYMVEEGCVRRTIHIALTDMGGYVVRIRWRAVWTMLKKAPPGSGRITGCRNLSGHLVRRQNRKWKNRLPARLRICHRIRMWRS